MAKLHSTVYVDGVGYGPDSVDIPPKVAARIGGHAWEGGKGPQSKSKEPDNTSDGESAPPPMGGKGSGADEWRAYAAEVNVEVPDEASRDDIVEAIKTAGKPVERPAS